MKDYLNSEEERDMITLITAVFSISKKFHKFVDSKGQGDFKRGTSFIMKGIDNIFNRIGNQELDKLEKKAKYMMISAVDEEKYKILKKRKSADMMAAYEDNKEYFSLVEITMDINCQGCEKCFKDCDLYKHFDEQQLTPFDSYTEAGHCKFSYRKWLNMIYRTVEEITMQAVKNTLLRLRTDKPIEIEIRRTGNKKALHQKGKNKIKKFI